MVNMHAKYYDFKHRLFISAGFSIGLIVFIAIEIFVLYKPGLLPQYFIVIQMFMLLLLSIFFYICYIKAKTYIEKIEVKEQSIILTVYLYDTKLESIEIPFSQLIIYLNKNLYERFPRYTLTLKRTGKEKETDNELILKQYEIGFWNRDNLKNAYNIIFEKGHTKP